MKTYVNQDPLLATMGVVVGLTFGSRRPRVGTQIILSSQDENQFYVPFLGLPVSFFRARVAGINSERRFVPVIAERFVVQDSQPLILRWKKGRRINNSNTLIV
jgi:hypothetical protein